MFRTGRTARGNRVAAVARVLGAPLRRTLLLGGLAVAAWLLGTVAASADTLGTADTPAQSAVRGAGPGGDASAADIRDSADSASPVERPAGAAADSTETPDTSERDLPEVAVPELDAPEVAVSAVEGAPEPPGPSAGDVVAEAAEDADGRVREAAGAASGIAPDRDGGHTGRDERSPAEPRQHGPEPAGHGGGVDPEDRSGGETPESGTGLPDDTFDAAAQHDHHDARQAVDADSDPDGAPASGGGSAALPAQAQSSALLTMVAGYLPRFTGPHRSGGAAQAQHRAAAPAPQVPVADRSFSPD